jgi:hypothetical protein
MLGKGLVSGGLSLSRGGCYDIIRFLKEAEIFALHMLLLLCNYNFAQS